MIGIALDPVTYQSTTVALAALGKNIPREMAIAINKAGPRIVSRIGAGISDRVNIKRKDIDPRIQFSPRATPSRLSGRVVLSKSERIPIRYFGARQVQAGVSYRINKGDAMKIARSAFGPPGYISGRGARGRMGIARLGNNAFKRTTKHRLPIVKLHGPSPWGVFVKAGMIKPTAEFAQQELNKQVQERLRFAFVKARGLI